MCNGNKTRENKQGSCSGACAGGGQQSLSAAELQTQRQKCHSDQITDEEGGTDVHDSKR
jgi:iron only hydrogenase large subunit-like protein